jgi:1-acyl-sn-glycerol-3-phosphate acyltransferase
MEDKNMMKAFRLLRRVGAVLYTALSTLAKYHWISFKHRKDKESYIKASQNLSQRACDKIVKAANVDIVVKGAPIHEGPAIYLPNHMSYLDFAVLGSVTKTSFVSKEETEKQPFIGAMLRAMSTTFIKRTSDDLPRACAEIKRKVADGRNHSWYPEATTTDGSFVLPFRAGLLQGIFNEEAKAEGYKDLNRDLRVQAFTMRLTHINGVNVEENRAETQHLRDIFCNHIGAADANSKLGDALPVFKYMSTVKSARVEFIAHEPINPFECEDGRDIVNKAWHQVAPGIIESVDPNLELFELYRGERAGWKAPKKELMDECLDMHVKGREALKTTATAPKANI